MAALRDSSLPSADSCGGDLLTTGRSCHGPGWHRKGRQGQDWQQARDVSCSGWDCGELPAILWVALAF